MLIRQNLIAIGAQDAAQPCLSCASRLAHDLSACQNTQGMLEFPLSLELQHQRLRELCCRRSPSSDMAILMLKSARRRTQQ